MQWHQRRLDATIDTGSHGSNNIVIWTKMCLELDHNVNREKKNFGRIWPHLKDKMISNIHSYDTG